MLVSPIAYEDHGLTTPNVEGRNKDLAAYTVAMQEVAEQEGILFINLYEDTRAIMDNIGEGPLKNSPPMASTSPPSATGPQLKLIASKLTDTPMSTLGLHHRRLQQYRRPHWSQTHRNLYQNKGTLSFQVTETTPASPPPPTGATTPSYFKHGRDTLIVENLAPATTPSPLTAKRSPPPATSNGHEGIPIDNSPAHQEAEAFRAAINDKNLQFLYNWKALNQVHIVGERTRSPSGKSLPAEQVEFNKLAQQKEKVLREPYQPKTRQWTLTPTKRTKPTIP